MFDYLVLAFLNMTETFKFEPKMVTDIGIATLGANAFFSILILAMVGIVYYHNRDATGGRNIAVIPISIIIFNMIFSLMIPPATSILLWVLGFFLAGGSVFWKAIFKSRGEY